jgi:hypothetical protein
MSLGCPAKTSRPLRITGVVSLELELLLLLVVTGLLSGVFRGRGDPDISGERLTTDAPFGDGSFFPTLSGSYGLNEKGFDDVTTVGGD